MEPKIKITMTPDFVKIEFTDIEHKGSSWFYAKPVTFSAALYQTHFYWVNRSRTLQIPLDMLRVLKAITTLVKKAVPSWKEFIFG